MKEQFVTYDIALKLKELGFNEECLAIYTHNNEHYTAGTFFLHTPHPFTIEELTPEIQDIRESAVYILAPLWQQVIDWFREKYNYHIDITFRESDTNKIEGINSVYFDMEIYHLRDGDAYKVYKYSEISDNYYYTREAAILKAIELCQKEK